MVSIALGAPSKPKTSSQTDDVKLFTEGTSKLFKLDFVAAEQDFRASLKANDKNAKAHNNLAFVLRKQGPNHYQESLKHYNRAIQLDDELAEAYMYRGVLQQAMGANELALKDHARLLVLNEKSLADELEWVITNGKEKDPAQFFGVVAK